jgi:hypothetical protein
VDLNDPEIARIRGELLDPSSATSWYVQVNSALSCSQSARKGGKAIPAYRRGAEGWIPDVSLLDDHPLTPL